MENARPLDNPNGCKEEPRPQTVNYASALTDAHVRGPYTLAIHDLEKRRDHYIRAHGEFIENKAYAPAGQVREAMDSVKHAIAVLRALNGIVR